MNKSIKDLVSWSEVKVDNQCWSHKGRYLGRCIETGFKGRHHDPDPFFRFSETGAEVFSDLFLTFTKVPCQDRKSLLQLHTSLQQPGIKSKTGIEKILGDEMKVREIAQFMDPLPAQPAAMATTAAASAQPVNERGSFTPIVLHNSQGNKIYECPICHIKTGTMVPEDPEKYASDFAHNYNCSNKNKIPREEPTGGRKYKKKSIKRKRHSKKCKHSKSKKSKKYYKK